jgi:hypothetical protein
MSSDECGSECGSEDSISIEDVLEMAGDPREDGMLFYLCRTSDNTEEIFDRSDLMDGGKHQKLVLRFERKQPPPWDVMCTICGRCPGQTAEDCEVCEECECQEYGCELMCRHISGVNYGCIKHPVI